MVKKGLITPGLMIGKTPIQFHITYSWFSSYMQRVMCQCSVGALFMYTLHEVICSVLFMSKGVFTQS